MPKHFIDINNTVTEIINTQREIKKLQQEKKDTFSPGVWSELESGWGRQAH